MSRDRKYLYARGRKNGFRRSADASGSAQTAEDLICTDANQSSLPVSVVSPAISGAVPPSNGRELLKTETKDATRKSSSQSGSKSKKPNCYKCKYRGSIPGNAHTKCVHPAVEKISNDPLISAIGMMRRNYRDSALGSNISGELGGLLGVSGNPHGIRNGWFSWPVNFDSVWLESCDGFEPMEAV